MVLSSLIVHAGLIGFYPSYRDVPWKDLINHANKSLDCVVYYWDKWVENNRIELHNFLEKPHSHISFIFADNENAEIEREILRLFPNNSALELAQKIKQTYEPFLRIALSKVSIIKVPYLLQYSLQVIDDSIAVISLFDLHRISSSDSPAFVIDLDKAPDVKRFCLKELEGMKKSGRRIEVKK